MRPGVLTKPLQVLSEVSGGRATLAPLTPVPTRWEVSARCPQCSFGELLTEASKDPSSLGCAVHLLLSCWHFARQFQYLWTKKKVKTHPLKQWDPHSPSPVTAGSDSRPAQFYLSEHPSPQSWMEPVKFSMISQKGKSVLSHRAFNWQDQITATRNLLVSSFTGNLSVCLPV